MGVRHSMYVLFAIHGCYCSKPYEIMEWVEQRYCRQFEDAENLMVWARYWYQRVCGNWLSRLFRSNAKQMSV